MTMTIAIDNCVICLEAINNEHKLPCNHIFHKDCIDQWKIGTCPICRYDYSISNLHEHHNKGFTSDPISHAMYLSTIHGHLEIVKWVHLVNCGNEGESRRAIDYAAESGHLEVPRWLNLNKN